MLVEELTKSVGQSPFISKDEIAGDLADIELNNVTFETVDFTRG